MDGVKCKSAQHDSLVGCISTRLLLLAALSTVPVASEALSLSFWRLLAVVRTTLIQRFHQFTGWIDVSRNENIDDKTYTHHSLALAVENNV